MPVRRESVSLSRDNVQKRRILKWQQYPLRQSSPPLPPWDIQKPGVHFVAKWTGLFDRFTGGFGMMPFPALRTEPAFGIGFPAVDVAEDETSFKLSAELPGMADKDIQVALSGDTLTIRGEKRQDKEEKKSGYHLSERSYGEFQRAFTLPDGVDGEKIAAAFANGVLTVTVPKKAQAVAKKIQVKAA